MKFSELSAQNQFRCEESFHPVEEWSEADWMTAIAGEVGEAANWIKKRRRYSTDTLKIKYDHPDAPSVDTVIDELADAVIYIDLLCTRMGGNLEDGIRRKFNEVSDRVGSTRKL
jgi:NTP pyrophosphatase (non-canonical NTP hydrolase)